jgi:hypothetical protein
VAKEHLKKQPRHQLADFNKEYITKLLGEIEHVKIAESAFSFVSSFVTRGGMYRDGPIANALDMLRLAIAAEAHKRDAELLAFAITTGVVLQRKPVGRAYALKMVLETFTHGWFRDHLRSTTWGNFSDAEVRKYFLRELVKGDPLPAYKGDELFRKIKKLVEEDWVREVDTKLKKSKPGAIGPIGSSEHEDEEP